MNGSKVILFEASHGNCVLMTIVDCAFQNLMENLAQQCKKWRFHFNQICSFHVKWVCLRHTRCYRTTENNRSLVFYLKQSKHCQKIIWSTSNARKEQACIWSSPQTYSMMSLKMRTIKSRRFSFRNCDRRFVEGHDQVMVLSA